MYAALVQEVLTGAEEAPAARRIERMRKRHPGLSRDELADRLIRRTAWRCAGVGALTGAPAGWLGAAPVAADLPFHVVALTRLALDLALIYRRRPDVSERGLSAAGSLVLTATAGALRSGAVKLLHRELRRRRSSVTAPLLGALAGGALAYAAAVAFGLAARDHYGGRGWPFPR